MEAPGFEPGAFRMRSGHSTTELCPLDFKYHVITILVKTFARASFLVSRKENQDKLHVKIKASNQSVEITTTFDKNSRLCSY